MLCRNDFLLQKVMKKLENVERKLDAYYEKMVENISKTSEDVVNPPVSWLKKPGGTNVLKMTKFKVGTALALQLFFVSRRPPLALTINHFSHFLL